MARPTRRGYYSSQDVTNLVNPIRPLDRDRADEIAVKGGDRHSAL